MGEWVRELPKLRMKKTPIRRFLRKTVTKARKNNCNLQQ